MTSTCIVIIVMNAIAAIKTFYCETNIGGKKKIFDEIAIIPEPADSNNSIIDNLFNKSYSNTSFGVTQRDKKAFEIITDSKISWEDNTAICSENKEVIGIMNEIFRGA